MTQDNDVVDPKYKDIIDRMSYESLLRRWRNAAAGDSMFQGATGTYYSERMAEKKAELTHDEQVQASKNIGWGGE